MWRTAALESPLGPGSLCMSWKRATELLVLFVTVDSLAYLTDKMLLYGVVLSPPYSISQPAHLGMYTRTLELVPN